MEHCVSFLTGLTFQCGLQNAKARALAARAAREAALADAENKRKEAAQAKLAELEERIQRRHVPRMCMRYPDCWVFPYLS